MIRSSAALRIDFELAQARGERVRELGGVRFGRLGRWQQEAGFEKREPRGHDQIIGGQFQAKLAGGLDEEEVLLRQRQNGNPREIDFLPPRQFKQKVKRSLEPVEIDGERRLAGRLDVIEAVTKLAGVRHESPGRP